MQLPIVGSSKGFWWWWCKINKLFHIVNKRESLDRSSHLFWEKTSGKSQPFLSPLWRMVSRFRPSLLFLRSFPAFCNCISAINISGSIGLTKVAEKNRDCDGICQSSSHILKTAYSTTTSSTENHKTGIGWYILKEVVQRSLPQIADNYGKICLSYNFVRVICELLWFTALASGFCLIV